MWTVSQPYHGSKAVFQISSEQCGCCQPRFQGLSSPHPKERPWFRLFTCLDNKFIFEEGVPIYQSIVAAAVWYLLNRPSGQPWNALFRFRSEDLSYQINCFQHLKLTGSGNYEKIRMSNYNVCFWLQFWIWFEIKSSSCTWATESCCFGSLQRLKRGEWLLDKSLNSFF